MHGSSSSSVYKDLALPLANVERDSGNGDNQCQVVERPTAQLLLEGINSKRKKEKLIKGLECRLW